MPEIHLLTGAYALDALDDVERAGFERHLRSCPSCSVEVREFHEAAGALADRVALAPPDGLRERVLAEVSRTRQMSPGGPRGSRLPTFSLRSTFVAAAASVLVAAATGLGAIAWQGQQAVEAAQAQAQAAQVRAADVARVMTDPGRIEVVGESSLGGSATVVASGGTAVFATDRLPAPPEGKEYQVWLIDKAGVRSVGMLQLNDGSGQSLVSGVTDGASVAVSVEPAGGSKQPTTKPILSLRVA